MTDEAQDKNVTQWSHIARGVASAIDKLTDPVELAIRKTFSAKFLISVGTTFFFYKLSNRILTDHPEAAAQIFTCWATAWTTIVGTYFGASMNSMMSGDKKERAAAS